MLRISIMRPDALPPPISPPLPPSLSLHLFLLITVTVKSITVRSQFCNSPVWFTNHHMRALRIKINCVKHLSSELLNKCRVIYLLLRRHNRQLELGRRQSTWLCLIKCRGVQKIHRLGFVGVFDLQADWQSCWCGTGDRCGRVRLNCYVHFSYVTFSCVVRVGVRDPHDCGFL